MQLHIVVSISFQNNFSHSLPSAKKVKLIWSNTLLRIISQSLVNQINNCLQNILNVGCLVFVFFLISFYTPHLFQRGWFSGHSADIIYCIVSQHQHVLIINKRLEMFGEPGCQFTWCSMSQLIIHWNEFKLTFKKKKFLNMSASATWNSALLFSCDLVSDLCQLQVFS